MGQREKKTEVRLNVLYGLKMIKEFGDLGAWKTADEIKSIIVYEGTVDGLSQVLRRMFEIGWLARRGGRPRQYALTRAGNRALGSFPAAGEYFPKEKPSGAGD